MNRQRAKLIQDAEDGDSLASRLAPDAAQDEGEELVWPLKVGDWVYVYTAAHAYVGKVLALDYEEIVLGPEVTWVFETGELTTFVEKGEAAYCELYPAKQRIRRGGILSIGDYPLRRHPKQKK